MEWFGLKLGTEYIKAEYCHHACAVHGVTKSRTQQSDWTNLSRVHHSKYWAGWITSWNQDCQEKYQQPQICRWYHPYGRKWRGTKEPLDEGERGEWKSWLKLNIQKTKIMASHPHPFMANRRRKSRNSDRFSFLGLQNHCAQWLQSWK